MGDIQDFDLKYIHRLHPCSEDIMELLSSFDGELLDRNGKLRVVEIISSELDDDMKGKGIGYQMYLKVAQEAFKRNNRKSFLFIPNYCHGSSTSSEALRVWKSLARKYPSKGEVIVIRKTPNK